MGATKSALLQNGFTKGEPVHVDEGMHQKSAPREGVVRFLVPKRGMELLLIRKRKCDLILTCCFRGDY
jgi:hypothetical protein